jgi:hypothetical protein
LIVYGFFITTAKRGLRRLTGRKIRTVRDDWQERGPAQIWPPPVFLAERNRVTRRLE